MMPLYPEQTPEQFALWKFTKAGRGPEVAEWRAEIATSSPSAPQMMGLVREHLHFLRECQAEMEDEELVTTSLEEFFEHFMLGESLGPLDDDKIFYGGAAIGTVYGIALALGLHHSKLIAVAAADDEGPTSWIRMPESGLQEPQHAASGQYLPPASPQPIMPTPRPSPLSHPAPVPSPPSEVRRAARLIEESTQALERIDPKDIAFDQIDDLSDAADGLASVVQAFAMTVPWGRE